jgi:hypothetical protein
MSLSAKKHVVNRHFIDTHLVDRHLVDTHFADQYLVDTVMGLSLGFQTLLKLGFQTFSQQNIWSTRL